MESNQAKIFGIGLNKTGTTTLKICGKLLDLRATKFSRPLLKDVVLRQDFSRVKKTVEENDLFQDWPWPLIYREMDEQFPGSKFILTVRKSEDIWYESLKKHSLQTPPFRNCRKLAYGFRFPHRHHEEHLEIYRKHNREVREYFASRPDDFIELCWENGDGWEKLCKFLGTEVPDISFPKANNSEKRKFKYRNYMINKVLLKMNY